MPRIVIAVLSRFPPSHFARSHEHRPDRHAANEHFTERTCTASVNAAYTTMVTTIADARDAYHDDTPEADDPGGDPDGDPPGKLPVKPDPAAAAAAAQQIAEAKTDYQKALAAANLQLALDTNAAGTDQQALAAAQTAYDSAVAAALLAYQQSVTDALGDRSVADAQSVDDYVDDVYGEDGAYQTWQDAVSGAEAAYKTAESAAKETLTKNLAALDAALEAALVDTYADALEQLALDHPSPWAARAAADARAESDRVASEQAARQTYDEAVATAQADFAETVAGAEQTRSEAQIDAVCALKTTLSEANLDKASDQKTADDAAAEDGASTKKPDEETPPDAPGDVPANESDAAKQPLGAGAIIYDDRPSYGQYPYEWSFWDILDLAYLELHILAKGINQMEWVDHQEATRMHKDRVEEMIQLERGRISQAERGPKVYGGTHPIIDLIGPPKDPKKVVDAARNVKKAVDTLKGVNRLSRLEAATSSVGTRATRTLSQLLPKGYVNWGENGADFAKWFNDLTPEELSLVLKKYTLDDLVRYPGGRHEWLKVSELQRIKEWGVPMEEVWRFRTDTTKLVGKIPGTNETFAHTVKIDGQLRTGPGAKMFDNELGEVIRTSRSVEEFNVKLRGLLRRWSIDSSLIPKPYPKVIRG